MLSISKAQFAAVLDPSSDIPTDLIIEVHDDKGIVTVFHAHRYYLALVSKVLRRRFFGAFREKSDVLDVRGTTARAFKTLINFVYHRECTFKSYRKMMEVANLAEMYDVKGLMTEVEKALKQIRINLTNVVLVANVAERLSMFSSFNISEYLLTKCCNYLQKKLRTRVIDFSGLRFSRFYVETVKVLHDRILELPLTACQLCPQFVIDENHDCPYEEDDSSYDEDDDSSDEDDDGYLYPYWWRGDDEW